jgi:hypothetical protein
MQDLMVMTVRAASFTVLAARIAFSWQTFKLQPVMNQIRNGIVPATLLVLGLAPLSLAHGTPGVEARGGANFVEAPHAFVSQAEGISLDEAVSRAQQQYRARVVRTDVQDEDGRKVYVLKMLSDDGRVFTVRIDAATGRMR